MGVKRIIKKLANYILFSEPKEIVNVNVSQIDYGKTLFEKNIVITGGGRGLGFYMAKRCIQEGANIIISGRNIDVLKKSALELGEKCSYVQFDISDVENAGGFLKECEEKFKGKIDCLINNAGISLHEGSLENVTVEGFDKQFNINLKGTYFLSKAFIENKMKEEKYLNSNLLIISSQTGDYCSEIPYGMTKAALNSFIGALNSKVYRKGIRVNAIAPGVTLSDMTKEYAVTNNGNMWTSSTSGRYFLPEEVAEVAVWLLSDASKCISGEIIHCNAGNHLNTN